MVAGGWGVGVSVGGHSEALGGSGGSGFVSVVDDGGGCVGGAGFGCAVTGGLDVSVGGHSGAFGGSGVGC